MKFPLWNLSVAFAFFIVSFSCLAGNKTEILTFEHDGIDQPIQFRVTLPDSYHKMPDKRYVMMFDFHHHAHTYLSGMHDWMSHNGEWPWLETIIVTPVRGNRVGMLFDATGETTPLLDFFESELFPTIDDKYRTNGFRIFSGFRVNGSIVLSALINKPNIANAYIAISPELKNNMACILATAASKLKKQNATPKFLTFAHGESVKDEHQLADYQTLKGIIAQNAVPTVNWQYKNFKQHYFMSLPVLGTTVGIEQIFDEVHTGLAATSSVSQQGVAAIVEHYEYLSTVQYGFEVSPKFSIDELGFHLLKTAPEQGIAVIKERIKRFPKDSYSYHNAAKAYAQLGDYKNAVILQKKAVELTSDKVTWHSKRHKKVLAEYKSRLVK